MELNKCEAASGVYMPILSQVTHMLYVVLCISCFTGCSYPQRKQFLTHLLDTLTQEMMASADSDER